jgi:hypothetical protein
MVCTFCRRPKPIVMRFAVERPGIDLEIRACADCAREDVFKAVLDQSIEDWRKDAGR